MAALLVVALVAAGPKLVPDPLYKPKEGDIALVGFFDPDRNETFPAKGYDSEETFNLFVESVVLKKDEAKNKLKSEGKVVDIDRGSRVMIVRAAPESKRNWFGGRWLVRVLDKAQKGKQLFISGDDLLREAPVLKGASDPRAASLLRSAKNLEKEGRKAGAVEFYERIVKEFGGSLEAKEAAKRLKALKK